MSTFQPSRVKDARLRAGLTQSQLARAAATTEKNIARWENGHNEPRAQNLAALAVATGVDTNYFFDGGGEQEDVAPPGDPFPGSRRSDPEPRPGGSRVGSSRGVTLG